MNPLNPYIAGTPDPWAEPLHFARAVLDEGHAQHAWAVGQWRGLLALLALRSHHGTEYGLALEEVVLDPADPIAAMLGEFAPSRGLASGIGLWRSPMIVKACRAGWPMQPMAMINPMCLVSPARSFEAHWPVPAWMDKGLCDPLTAETPPPLTELAIMASWLSLLEGALLADADPAATAIHARVHAFRSECVTALGDHKIEVTPSPPIGCPLPAPFATLFADCRIAAIANPAALTKGHLTLDLPFVGKGKAGLRGAILADPALAHHYQQDARHILIWGARTLAEAMADPQVLDEIRADAAANGWLILTAQDLFADHMVRLGKHGVVPSHKGEARQCVLPLRPLALLFGERLRDMASVKFLDQGAIATLDLPMAGGGVMTLKRAYAASPVAGQGGYSDGVDWPMHAVSLWPDFICDDFDFYTARLFTTTSGPSGPGVEPISVLSKDHLVALAAGFQNSAEALLTLLRVNDGMPMPADMVGIAYEKLDGRHESETIWQSSKPFTAVTWSHPLLNWHSALCGLVLLNTPRLSARPEPMDVAVDFGTTNTMACFTDGEPISLAARLVVPIESSVPALNQAMRHDRRFVFNKFFPVDAHELPTPSVALSRNIALNRLDRSVARNVIYMPHKAAAVANGEALEADMLARDWTQCHFNLKWSDSSAANEASVDFLTQMLWMIAAEAVAKGHSPRALRWHFSVPDAMAPLRRSQFERVLDVIIGRISGPSSTYPTHKVLRAPLVSEGLAAARYMLAGDGQATHKLLTLVIDIGGATSDVALWDSDDVRWRGSFFLAGRDFFTSTLHARPDILDGIDLGYWGRILREAKLHPKVNDRVLPDIAELLFSGGGLTSALSAHWDGYLSGEGGAALRIAGLTFLGGLAWYLGLVTRRMLAQGVLHYGAQSSPAFALCGRGAGLFKLMHAGQPSVARSDVTSALSLFNTAAGLHDAPRPQLFMKQGAKLEVARGLLTDPARLRNAAANWYKKLGDDGAIADDLPIGLSVDFADEGRAAMTDLMAIPLIKQRALHIGFDDFAAFLAALRGAVGLSIDVRPDVPQAAWDRIEHNCLAQWSNARHAEETETIEPVFLTALRQLLRELIDPAAHAEGRIGVDFDRP